MANCLHRRVGIVSCFLFTLTFLNTCQAQKAFYNLSFDLVDEVSHRPENWFLPNKPEKDGYSAMIDSSVVEQGKYSLRIEKRDNTREGGFGVCTYMMSANTLKGRKITLTGHIKTVGITKGYAGLWLRVDGDSSKLLQFDNMNSRGIRNSTDWHKYTIELPYDELRAKNIVFGALLTGNGKLWIDNLNLYLDGKAIGSNSLAVLPKATRDTSYSVSSGILSIKLDVSKTKLLTNLGMIWGFLKYYHPAVIQGKYNWDAELFRRLPGILKADSRGAAYKLIEDWIDSLGPVPVCEQCQALQSDRVELQPAYGYLFDSNNLPGILVKKLKYIRDNYKPVTSQYYVGFQGANNPVFTNEITYPKNKYPDTGIRLLALYRYWNIVQFFFPSRNLIGDDWNNILTRFIPRFVDAKNTREYLIACLEIITSIHDTHANIWGYKGATLDSIKGLLMTPFQAKFVENKLVVRGYYKNIAGLKDKIHIGDIIEKIDGISVGVLIKKYLPLTPASNYQTQLRDLPTAWQGFLLRSNNRNVRLLIRRDNETFQVQVSRIALRDINYYMDFPGFTEKSGYKMLPGNIGYIFPGKLKNSDINTIRKKFANTKGLIIDLRSYPSSFMPFTYGAWLKSTATPFVYFTFASLDAPGTIIKDSPISNGDIKNTHPYRGKVVIIVNASTQSQAEYTTMALSTVPNSKVIGSTTAGADGNVSTISLPGGVSSYISGLGVYYPDGTQAQRKGVKIDIPVEPTIEGIRSGKDELLDKAVELINR